MVVERATLHNEDEIKRKGIKIGDYVVVKRQGDVIPAVITYIPDRRTGNEVAFDFPNNCPKCNSELIRPIGEAVSRCPNPKCPAKIEQRIIHFASKAAMDIDGLGDKMVSLLLEHNLIKNFSDIFKLKFEELKDLPRMGELSSKNLLEAIEKSKDVDLEKFIFALGIRHIGERSAKILANYCKSIDKFLNLKYEEVLEIPEIGPETATAITEFISDEFERQLIDNLLKSGLRINFVEEKKEDSKITGKTFVITGTLENYSRPEMQKLIENKGGKVLSAISKKTDFLLAGENAGSKLEKAKSLGVTIIDEVNLLELLSS